MTVSLTAIAKDEGAYLAAWIFHHLYFGFDKINIFLDKGSDNSLGLLERISIEYPEVQYHDTSANSIYSTLIKDRRNFQCDVYQWDYDRNEKSPHNFQMYLDIDEFWTPTDFSSSIGDFINAMGEPDTISFEWAFKRNEKLFSRPFNQANNLLKHSGLKTVFRTSLNITSIGAHNILSENTVSRFADGTSLIYPGQKRREGFNKSGELEKAFVLHRFWRSQLEYVVLSIQKGMFERFNAIHLSDDFFLKTHRRGYKYPNWKGVPFSPEYSRLTNYNNHLKLFIQRCNIISIIEENRKAVINRFMDIHDKLTHEQINSSEYNLFKRNLDLEQALSEAKDYLKKFEA